jgi:hypothetical protein
MMSSHAVGQFGPVTPVLHADCQFDSASGDCAVDDQGTIHAFVAFTGKSCDQEPPINYVSGSGGSWTPATTPYRGWVLGMVVDGTQLFLLFSNSDGIHLGQLAQGQFTPSQTLSQHSPPAWGPTGEAGGGSVVAKNGKWWAVWSERADPGRPFHLFQASTMTSAGELLRQRIRSALSHALHNAAPSLTLDPADPRGAALAWFVTFGDAHGLQDGAVVRFARARMSDAVWHEKAWAPPRPRPDRNVSGPGLFTSEGNLHGVYEDNDKITYTLNPPTGTVVTHFQTKGNGPQVAHSAGKTFVAWTHNLQRVVVGEHPAASSVKLEFGPSGSTDQLIGLVAFDGKATVLGATSANFTLCARTQT